MMREEVLDALASGLGEWPESGCAHKVRLPASLDTLAGCSWNSVTDKGRWVVAVPGYPLIGEAEWRKRRNELLVESGGGAAGSGNRSDGSTASYYELPEGCKELQDLISYRNMNAQDGEIIRAIYRKGRASHSDALRDAKKVLFYAKAEVERLEKYGKES